MTLQPDILTISSQVIHGSVGNRATQTVLAQFGHRVWSLPTILLPWHPGHGKGHRTVIEPEAFEAMVEDLIQSPRLNALHGIMTGYLGAPEHAEIVARLILRIKSINPDTVYLCDPVMGDAGALYVPTAIAESIRDHLVPLADIITPNGFELDWLTGHTPKTMRDRIDAAKALNIRKVIQTSAAIEDGQTGLLMVTQDQTLLAKHKAFDHAPNGLGDMFGALILSSAIRGQDGAELLATCAARLYAFAEYCDAHGLDILPLNSAALWENDRREAIQLMDTLD